MPFTLVIYTDNAAFDGGPGDREAEVARIIRDLAARIERGDCSGSVRDSNGNMVGEFSMPEPEEIEE